MLNDIRSRMIPAMSIRSKASMAWLTNPSPFAVVPAHGRRHRGAAAGQVHARIVNHHGGALAGDREWPGSAQPAPCAGHDGYLAFE